MPAFSQAVAVWAAITVWINPADAVPELTFPINSQVPPVAYVAQEFSFAFSSSTFQSTASSLSYQLSNGPPWLSLNSDTRTFTGTPIWNDTGASTFQLSASDTGGTTTSNVTLCVLNKPNVLLQGSILPFPEDVGPLSGPNTLALRPLIPFHISLSRSLFSGTPAKTHYYATSNDSSPLPPWINFEPASFSFSGSTPALVSPHATQQNYAFRLVASDVIGFEEAAFTFRIAVSYHILAFTAVEQFVNVTAGQFVTTRPFIDTLQLDGAEIPPAAISNSYTNAPAWLSMDPKNLSFGGTPPDDFDATDITVTVSDIYGDMANLTVRFQTSHDVKPAPNMHNLNATARTGQWFSFALNQSLSKSFDRISANLANTSSWLAFSSQNLSLYGLVPKDLASQTVRISFVASNSYETEETNVTLRIEHGTTTSSITSSIPTSTEAQSTFLAPSNFNNTNSLPSGRHITTRRTVEIVLGILLPLIAVSAIIGLGVCSLTKRNRRRKSRESKDESTTPNAEVENTLPATATDVPAMNEIPPVAGGTQQASVRQMTPTQAPKVELLWISDSLQRAKDRLSGIEQTKKSGLSSSPRAEPTELPLGGGTNEVALTAKTSSNKNKERRPRSINWLESSKSAEPRTSPTQPVSKRTSARAPIVSAVFDDSLAHHSVLSNQFSGAGHGSGGLRPQLSAEHSSQQSVVRPLVPLGEMIDSKSRGTHSALQNIGENDQDSDFHNNTKMRPQALRCDVEPSAPSDIQRQRWHTERARDKLEGVFRSSDFRSSRISSLAGTLNQVRSPRRITSSIIENEALPSGLNQSLWSNWSSIGPARTESLLANTEPVSSAFKMPYRLSRHVSVASSGQFDSAISSDSNWEDDVSADARGGKGDHVLEPSQGRASQVTQATGKRGHVSMRSASLKRSEQSQRGSFRFI